MDEPRWLDAEQQRAWRALLVFVERGLPEIERTMKEHDLLVVHFSILVALSEAPDRTMRLTDLADAANVSPSRLTHRLRTLTERRDVTIAADPQDGRAKRASLTATGRQRLEEVAQPHAQDVLRLVFDHLGPAETTVVADALSKVAAGLCDHPAFLATQPSTTGGPTGA
jgi:DNA-binding MarR family transcriptional regulator